MLQHYVLIKFKKGTSAEHIGEFCKRMLALPTAISSIEHLEIGRDILHDARSWDLILIMRFASTEALRGYQQHPEHLRLMAFNQPSVADVASVDFESPQPV
ncbi:MAG TPA: Dabb family protein [Bryobacteraceae bacterium]|nr:Dabb family protein [Bryobacteraceae bacterium]